jgi:hypothetical protein
LRFFGLGEKNEKNTLVRFDFFAGDISAVFITFFDDEEHLRHH